MSLMGILLTVLILGILAVVVLKPFDGSCSSAHNGVTTTTLVAGVPSDLGSEPGTCG